MAQIKTLTTPVAQPSIDKARLMDVMVNPAAKTMQVYVAKGFEANGKFEVKSVAQYLIAGADYDALMGAMGNPEVSIRESLEEAIWAKLEAMGAIAVE